jgi:hypothetical protein
MSHLLHTKQARRNTINKGTEISNLKNVDDFCVNFEGNDANLLLSRSMWERNIVM